MSRKRNTLTNRIQKMEKYTNEPVRLTIKKKYIVVEGNLNKIYKFIIPFDNNKSTLMDTYKYIKPKYMEFDQKK